jgi:nucleoid-associated protein YgaU
VSRLALVLVGIAGLMLTGCQQPAKTEPAVVSTPAPTLDPSERTPVQPLDSYTAAPPPVSPEPAYTPPPKPVTIKPADKSGKVSAEHGRTYTVQKGDNLSKIAKKLYGNQNRWRDIYDANKSRIKDPNKLQVGTKLVIP